MGPHPAFGQGSPWLNGVGTEAESSCFCNHQRASIRCDDSSVGEAKIMCHPVSHAIRIDAHDIPARRPWFAEYFLSRMLAHIGRESEAHACNIGSAIFIDDQIVTCDLGQVREICVDHQCLPIETKHLTTVH